MINLELQLVFDFEFNSLYIQLFRERLSQKNVHVIIPKSNMVYDQCIVPDTVAVEPTFAAFL